MLPESVQTKQQGFGFKRQVNYDLKLDYDLSIYILCINIM